MKPVFSVVVPVYNRPDELDELLKSLTHQIFKDFEVIIIEDGSELRSEGIIDKYSKSLNSVVYKYIPNGGPGPARNEGASIATGEWLIFFDSDCIIPEGYFDELYRFLSENSIDAFGGPDRAHESFSTIQKAISYSMTSILTTGGIRGNNKSAEKFKPRSFNLGIKAMAFDDLNGFAPLRFGEDLDLSLRLERKDYMTTLIPECWVYHKRRTNFKQFYKQVFNSGLARIILGKLHPGTTKIVHLFPAVFTLGLLVSVIAALAGIDFLIGFYGVYALGLLIHSMIATKSFTVAITSVVSSYVQLCGYGLGFVYGAVRVYILGKQDFAFRDNFYN
ncbi:MAG: glycosyltransferase [Bacteroidota bacterium]